MITKINRSEYLEVRVSKGATLHCLTRLASSHLGKYPFDVVYIVGGICDVTTKDSATGRISFDWVPPAELGNQLVKRLYDEDEFMRRQHPASRVVFCPLVGVELEEVVNSHAVNREQQEAVNEAVFDFNTEIFSINERRGTFSPSLHRTVHRTIRGKNKSYYHHLSDGIHPTEELKGKWADEFVKAIARN